MEGQNLYRCLSNFQNAEAQFLFFSKYLLLNSHCNTLAGHTCGNTDAGTVIFWIIISHHLYHKVPNAWGEKIKKSDKVWLPKCQRLAQGFSPFFSYNTNLMTMHCNRLNPQTVNCFQDTSSHHSYPRQWLVCWLTWTKESTAGRGAFVWRRVRLSHRQAIHV